MADGRQSQLANELKRQPNLLAMANAFENEGANDDVMVHA
jgi:hypothetical protein